MDQKWLFKHVTGVIVLVLSNITETETLEYYCTGEGNWTTAMSTCLDSGGTPASYLDLANGTDVNVKEGTTVWTADYVYLHEDYAEGLSQINTIYDCGYVTFKESRHWSSTKWKYTYTGDVNYDICTRKRRFMCENSSNTFEGWWTANWPEAYNSCRDPYKLWKGYASIEKANRPDFYLYPEFWVNSVRRLVQDTLSRPIPVRRSITNCGTSEEISKREGNNNCDQDLQAICRFERKITNTRFSQSCLQDGLSKTTTIVIATAAKAVTIGCIVTVILVLYFCRKRRKRTEANSGTVQFKNDSPSTGRVSLSRHDNTADRACNHNQAEAEAYYEVVSDKIQTLYVNEPIGGYYEVVAPVKLKSVYGNKTQERYNAGLVPDSIQSVNAIGKEEGCYEAVAPVKQESVYVNNTPEGYYEGLVPDNTEYV